MWVVIGLTSLEGVLEWALDGFVVAYDVCRLDMMNFTVAPGAGLFYCIYALLLGRWED